MRAIRRWIIKEIIAIKTNRRDKLTELYLYPYAVPRNHRYLDAAYELDEDIKAWTEALHRSS